MLNSRNYVNTICGIVFVHGHRSIKKRYRSRQCQKRIRRQHFLKISLPSQSISNYPTTFLCDFVVEECHVTPYGIIMWRKRRPGTHFDIYAISENRKQ